MLMKTGKTLKVMKNDSQAREKLVINTKFAAPLADSITVVFQILTLTVLVRNQVGQPSWKKLREVGAFCVFTSARTLASPAYQRNAACLHVA